MIKHIWSVLCRETVIDNQTNNISLFSVFERIAVDIKTKSAQKTKHKTNLPIKYELVNLWFKSKENHEGKATTRLELLDPTGKLITSIEKKLIIPAKIRRMRERFQIEGLPIVTSGIYIFKVKIKETGLNKFKTVAAIPLEVIIK